MHGILDAIGNTPIVELRHLVGPGMARVLVKLEGANPTGSKKDRMAREAVLAAERDGRLEPGQPVVEYTGGSTGTSLAFVCAATRHPLYLVSSDAFSQEKRDHMAALGATVIVIPSDNGKITQDLIKAMIACARDIQVEKGAYWTDQLNNPDAAAGYHGLGDEIWNQAGGAVDAYVESVGTAHGLIGVGEILRKHNPRVELIAAEPAESPILSKGTSGSHRIEGIGIGFVPPAWADDLADRIEIATTEEAQDMARRLAAEEAIFAGTSTGLNVIAALRTAERLGPGRTVATIAVDSGMKYLSTEVYRRAT